MNQYKYQGFNPVILRIKREIKVDLPEFVVWKGVIKDLFHLLSDTCR